MQDFLTTALAATKTVMDGAQFKVRKWINAQLPILRKNIGTMIRRALPTWATAYMDKIQSGLSYIYTAGENFAKLIPGMRGAADLASRVVSDFGNWVRDAAIAVVSAATGHDLSEVAATCAGYVEMGMDIVEDAIRSIADIDRHTPYVLCPGGEEARHVRSESFPMTGDIDAMAAARMGLEVAQQGVVRVSAMTTVESALCFPLGAVEDGALVTSAAISMVLRVTISQEETRSQGFSAFVGTKSSKVMADVELPWRTVIALTGKRMTHAVRGGISSGAVTTSLQATAGVSLGMVGAELSLALGKTHHLSPGSYRVNEVRCQGT